MLKRLYLKNFRAFSELDIPLTKINLFFGPNNSGKSAILSSINLLSQTIQSADPEVPLLLDGKFEDLGTYQDIVYKNVVRTDIDIGFEFEILPDLKKRIGIIEKIKLGDIGRIDMQFHYRKQRRQTVVNSLTLRTDIDDVLLRTRIAKVSNNQVIEQVNPYFSKIPVGKVSSGIIQLNHYLPYIISSHFIPSFGKNLHQRFSFRRYGEFNYLLSIVQRTILDELTNVEFIGPFRRNPLRIYPFSGESPSSVGPHGDKTIDILAADESRRHGKKRGTLQHISNWFHNSHIADFIKIEPVTERNFTVLVKHYNTGELANLADAGYGCSQILPILVAGYTVPEGSKLIIEQPEIHLHPNAEAEVGSFIYDVSKRNVQVFVETHSEHLLLRLQSYVAAKKLSPKDINVFFVYSNEKEKVCKRIPISEDGYFSEDWPLGFFPERLREAKRIAKNYQDNIIN